MQSEKLVTEKKINVLCDNLMIPDTDSESVHSAMLGMVVYIPYHDGYNYFQTGK